MKKYIAYDTRVDELPYFDEIAKQLGVEVLHTDAALSPDTLSMAEGCDGISILGARIVDPPLLDRIKAMGIYYLSTRTIGYNHIDVEYAEEIGIHVSNVSYDPEGVAEFTVMMILMALRKYKEALFRANVNDYSLNGLQGKELRHCTVGVLGTGSIARAVIRLLSGFGCRILAYSPHSGTKKDLPEQTVLVDFERLIAESDILTLHIPLTKSSYHIINREVVDKMKKGVVLVNCSRGGLMDTPTLISGIETKKIAALALDVFEHESGIYHFNRTTDIIANRDMAYLRQFPNVIMTQHIAFYTDAAIKSMVESSIRALFNHETMLLG